MKNNTNTTYFGTLEKYETLTPIPLGDDYVYESRSPFVGYYDDLPGKVNDLAYLYMVIACPLSFADLHGALLNTMKALKADVDLAHATLQVFDESYCAIRVRGFKNVEELIKVQKQLKGEGVDLLSVKGKNAVNSITRISKYFAVKPVGEGLWLDNNVANHGYIQLDEKLGLKELEDVVKYVHNNWQGHHFTAALAVLSAPDEALNAVRIYSEKVKEDNFLTDLQKVFKSALR